MNTIVKLSFVLILVLCNFCTEAQQQTINFPRPSQYTINLGMGNVELAGEFRLAQKFSLYTAAGFGMSMLNNLNEYKYRREIPSNHRADILLPVFIATPYFSAEGRYYYMFNYYERKNKITHNNTGPYAAITAKILAPTDISVGDKEHYATHYRLGIVNGFQKGIGKNFIFNGYIGLQYIINKDASYGSFFPAGNVKFGYLINK